MNVDDEMPIRRERVDTRLRSSQRTINLRQIFVQEGANGNFIIGVWFPLDLIRRRQLRRTVMPSDFMPRAVDHGQAVKLAFRHFGEGYAIWLLAIWIAIGFVFRGMATTVSAISDPTLPGRAWEIFFYAGDKWQVNNKLTVDLGLRWAFAFVSSWLAVPGRASRAPRAATAAAGFAPLTTTAPGSK